MSNCDYNPYGFLRNNPYDQKIFINKLAEELTYKIKNVNDTTMNQMFIEDKFELWFPLEPNAWSVAKINASTAQMIAQFRGLSKIADSVIAKTSSEAKLVSNLKEIVDQVEESLSES